MLGLVMAAQLIVGGFSHHIDQKVDFNDVHNTVGLQLDSGYEVMLQQNSYYKPSVIVSRKFGWKHGLGVRVGLASGYYDPGELTIGNTGIAPFAQATYTIWGDGEIVPSNLGAEIGFIPSFGNEYNKGVVTLSFRVKL